MLEDPRKILLVNRIALMGNPELKSREMTTHIHMSWESFYNTIAHQTPQYANVILLSPCTHYEDAGVLMDIEAVMSQDAILNDLEVPHDPRSIH